MLLGAALIFGALSLFIHNQRESTNAGQTAGNLLPVLIELDDGARLQRALNRERKQKHPKYEEMCRRFLADSEDFSEDKIIAAGITNRFKNDVFEDCLDKIRNHIRQFQ